MSEKGNLSKIKDGENMSKESNQNENNIVYVRICKRETIEKATEPVKFNIEDFKKCSVPFKGETKNEFFDYLISTPFYEVSGLDAYDDELNYLDYQDSEDFTEYWSSDENGERKWMELGSVTNDKYEDFIVEIGEADN